MAADEAMVDRIRAVRPRAAHDAERWRPMTTVPLEQWTVPEAMDAQFRLVDAFHREFDGYEALDAGDYGASGELGRSRATARVERVLARFFGAEDAILVPGAGTGALRSAL